MASLLMIAELRNSTDEYLVSWDGPNDPQNPKNWDKKKRWYITVLISLFMFVSPVSSSMVAPAFDAITSEFEIQNEVQTQMILSVFVLASVVGPLVISPLSEVYGRLPVLQITCFVYLIFNLACGFCQTGEQLLAFRFLSGLGGSAPSIGGGILSDCWRAEERGRSLSFYYVAPLLGPVVGPIVGGYITQHTNWRWMFYTTSLLDAVIQITGFLFLEETFAPVLLQRKAIKKRRENSNPHYHTKYGELNRSFKHVLATALIRPFKLLGTQGIIQVLATYNAYIYGLMYLALSTFPSLWVMIYEEPTDIASLNYLSLGIGFFLGTQICAPINDYIYNNLKSRNDGVGLPEYRVPLMVPGALLVPIGFLWYGWSIEAKLHWMMPNMGATIFASGITIGMQCITAYIVDAYSLYAASAIAATTVLRSLGGFGFPLLAPYLYRTMKQGWGNSLLALLSILIGWPAPYLLWRFGAIIRRKSLYAAGDE